MRVLYDDIGEGYDTTRQSDPYISSRLAFHLDLQGTGRYLDVACGTGNYTLALAQVGGWVGIDRSTRMLAQASKKTDRVAWICADAEALPFGANVFHSAVCVLAIHHFRSSVQAIREIARVISGRFVVFTSTREQMRHYWLREYFPDAMQKSLLQMPTRCELLSAIQAGKLTVRVIENYSIKEDLRDKFLYAGKHRPTIYLDRHIRKGIFTFSSIADPSEVEQGLDRLRADIRSGVFDAVRDRYKSEEGDYCFIVASK